MSRLVTLAASFRDGSTNQRLVDLAANIAAQHGANIAPVRYNDTDSPLLRDDEPALSIPDGAKHFSDAMHAADGLLLSTPEFNWSIPGSLKNLIDWLSLDPTHPLKGKNALLMSASPSLRGGVMGLSQLRTPLSLMGMHVYPQLIGIGNAHEMVSETNINNEKEQQFIEACVKDFVHITRKHT